MKKYVFIALLAAFIIVAYTGFNQMALSKKNATYEALVYVDGSNPREPIANIRVRWDFGGGNTVARYTNSDGKVTITYDPLGSTYTVSVSDTSYPPWMPVNPPSGSQTLPTTTLQAAFSMTGNWDKAKH